MNSQMTNDWEIVIERTKKIQTKMTSLMTKFANISDDYKPTMQPTSCYQDYPDSINLHFKIHFTQLSHPLKLQAPAMKSSKPTNILSYKNFLLPSQSNQTDQIINCIHYNINPNLQNNIDHNQHQEITTKNKLSLMFKADILPQDQEVVEIPIFKTQISIVNQPLEKQNLLACKNNTFRSISQSAELLSQDNLLEICSEEQISNIYPIQPTQKRLKINYFDEQQTNQNQQIILSLSNNQQYDYISTISCPLQINNKLNITKNPKIFESLFYFSNDEPDELIQKLINQHTQQKSVYPFNESHHLNVVINPQIFDLPSTCKSDIIDDLSISDIQQNQLSIYHNPQEPSNATMNYPLTPNKDDALHLNIARNPCIFNFASYLYIDMVDELNQINQSPIKLPKINNSLNSDYLFNKSSYKWIFEVSKELQTDQIEQIQIFHCIAQSQINNEDQIEQKIKPSFSQNQIFLTQSEVSTDQTDENPSLIKSNLILFPNPSKQDEIQENLPTKTQLNYIFQQMNLLLLDTNILENLQSDSYKESISSTIDNQSPSINLKNSLTPLKYLQEDNVDEIIDLSLPYITSKISKPIIKTLIQLPYKKQLHQICSKNRILTDHSSQLGNLESEFFETNTISSQTGSQRSIPKSKRLQSQWFKFPLKLLKESLPEANYFSYQDLQISSQLNVSDTNDDPPPSLLKKPISIFSKSLILSIDNLDYIQQDKINDFCKSGIPDLISDRLISKKDFQIFSYSMVLPIDSADQIPSQNIITASLIDKNDQNANRLNPKSPLSIYQQSIGLSIDLIDQITLDKDIQNIQIDQSDEIVSQLIPKFPFSIFQQSMILKKDEIDDISQQNNIQFKQTDSLDQNSNELEQKTTIAQINQLNDHQNIIQQFVKLNSIDKISEQIKPTTMPDLLEQCNLFQMDQPDELNFPSIQNHQTKYVQPFCSVLQLKSKSKLLAHLIDIQLDFPDQISTPENEPIPVRKSSKLEVDKKFQNTQKVIIQLPILTLKQDSVSKQNKLFHSTKQINKQIQTKQEVNVPKLQELTFYKIILPQKKAPSTISSIFPTSLFKCTLKQLKETPLEVEKSVEQKISLFENTLKPMKHDNLVRLDFPIPESIELTVQIPERKMISLTKKLSMKVQLKSINTSNEATSSLKSLDRQKESWQKSGTFLIQMSKDSPQLQDPIINCPVKLYYQKPESQNTNVQIKMRPQQKQDVRIQSKTPQKILKNQHQRKDYSPIAIRVSSQKQVFKINIQLPNYTKIWERFKKGRCLGKGTFSDVYQAFDTMTNQVVALKIMEKDFIRKHRLIDLLMQEIKIQSYLDHPNILKMLGVLEEKRKLILVLEICECDLLNRLKSRQSDLSEQEMRGLAEQIGSALAFMHQQGVIHRDLKMENIMLYFDQVKLGDFGLSIYNPNFKHKKKYHLFEVCGTPGYMAPEVLTKKGYDLKADSYSFGVLLYELITGCFPDQKNYLMALQGRCSQLLIDLLRKLLEYDQSRRIWVCEAMQHPWFKQSVPKNFFNFI